MLPVTREAMPPTPPSLRANCDPSMLYVHCCRTWNHVQWISSTLWTGWTGYAVI
jgi:hypothetical protein